MDAPTSYDFNDRWPELPVFNQGQNPICSDEMFANTLNAFRRIYDGKATTYQPGKDFTYIPKPDPSVAATLDFTTPDGTMQMQQSGSINPGLNPTLAKQLLWTNGIGYVGVYADSIEFLRAYQPKHRTDMPVIYATAKDKPATVYSIDHAVLGVGYTPAGIIILNSWGNKFGLNGRAVMSWQFLRKYGSPLVINAYPPHPFNGLNGVN